MVLRREGLVRRDVPEEGERAQLLRRGGHVVAPRRQHVSRVLLWVEDSAHHDHRADRVCLELEGGDDAEVAAGAAHGPEEILVLGGARPAQLAVRGDDVDREEVVDREAVLATQVADAAVQRQAGDARGRDDAARHGEPEQLRLPVAVAPGRAALRPHRLRRRVDVDAAHLREVDDEAAVVDRVAGHVVAAALHREQQTLLAREVDRVDDVRRPGALHDQRRSAIDQPVPDRARVVIARIAGCQDDSANTFNERMPRFRVERRFSRQLVGHRLPPLAWKRGSIQSFTCLAWIRAYAGSVPESTLASLKPRAPTFVRRSPMSSPGCTDWKG